jgi:hypothetical protein
MVDNTFVVGESSDFRFRFTCDYIYMYTIFIGIIEIAHGCGYVGVWDLVSFDLLCRGLKEPLGNG